MKLALEAGRLDADRWIKEQGIEPEQFDEWVEFDEIRVNLEKIALQNAMGYAAILNRLKLICESSLIGYSNVPDAKPDDFMFWQKKPKKKKKEAPVSPADLTSMLKQRIAAMEG